MSTIILIFEAPYAGFFKTFGSEFVRFTTVPQLRGWELETAMKAHPACEDLVDFHYEQTLGKGHFILPDSSLHPSGRHTVRYPLPKMVTQRTVYRWQDRFRDETHTHIATGAHGFESLCCSEMLAEMVEKAEISADGKVTCPVCKIIWQDCRAFEPCDFSDGKLPPAGIPDKIFRPNNEDNKMKKITLNYDDISPRLVQHVIPDYGLSRDSSLIERRGEQIKQEYPNLYSWPSITLGEAEMYREDIGRKDRRIVGLSLPDFLTLLFDPRSRAEWDSFISKYSTAS